MPPDARLTRPTPARLGAALCLGSAVAVAAYRRGSLTKSGAGAATLIGTVTFLAGGPRWSGLLLSFFASSSVLSRLEARAPSGGKIAEMNERGSRRDAVQAAANGGIAAAAAAAYIAKPTAVAAAAYAGAIAAANADTWATEIGGFSRLPPRDIVSGYAVAAGSWAGLRLRAWPARLPEACSSALSRVCCSAAPRQPAALSSSSCPA